MIIQHNLKPIKFDGLPEFKPAFIERYSKLTDWEVFKKYTLSYLNRSLRVNTLKITPEQLEKRLKIQGWILEQIPWCKEGFWAQHEDGRLDLGNTVEHQLGYYYIQESASMIPPLILDPKPGEIVWDMCAAPGSKTTQMAQMMNNEGMIIANDVSGLRLAPLGVNLQRTGVEICVQLLGDSIKLNFPFMFDKILLDAPCSGVGTIRKSIKTITMWNPKTLSKINRTQIMLLETGWKHLKAGGVLVYSTCSTEPEENEAIVNKFITSHPEAIIDKVELPGFKHSRAVTEFNGDKYSDEVLKTLRVWPQDNDSQGFFVARIRKKE